MFTWTAILGTLYLVDKLAVAYTCVQLKVLVYAPLCGVHA